MRYGLMEYYTKNLRQVITVKGKQKFTLTKTFTFDSAHRLEEYEGKCSLLHGHTYKLEVTVSGRRDARGIILDFSEMKKIVEDRVINLFDHSYLNDLMEINPTAENLCAMIWEKLERPFEERNCILERVVLWETPTSSCTMEKVE